MCFIPLQRATNEHMIKIAARGSSSRLRNLRLLLLELEHLSTRRSNSLLQQSPLDSEILDRPVRRRRLISSTRDCLTSFRNSLLNIPPKVRIRLFILALGDPMRVFRKLFTKDVGHH